MRRPSFSFAFPLLLQLLIFLTPPAQVTRVYAPDVAHGVSGLKIASRRSAAQRGTLCVWRLKGVLADAHTTSAPLPNMLLGFPLPSRKDCAVFCDASTKVGAAVVHGDSRPTPRSEDADGRT